MTFQKRFGMRLCAARMKKGVTQQQLAQTIGVTTSCISMYEHGRRQPSFEVAYKISSALGIPMDTLACDSFAELASALKSLAAKIREYEKEVGI